MQRFRVAFSERRSSVAILEAMASSLPVVATDVGSVREMVLHNETGFLVAPEDPAGLRSAIQAILLDESLARDLGCRGRERVEEMFGFDTQVDGYLNLFRDLVQMRSAASLFPYRSG